MNKKRKNGGYEIVNSMQLQTPLGSKKEVVMGYNEKAPEPYVTWEYKDDRGYDHGHYFSTKDGAVKDFFKRGMIEMACDMRREYQKENALSDIESALEWTMGRKQAEKLLKHDDFVALAMHVYNNIDHSTENEALIYNLETLYKDMVKEQKIFDLELLSSMQLQNVIVTRNNGTNVSGKVFVPSNHLDYIMLEVMKDEQERTEYIDIHVDEVSEIRFQDGINN